MKINHPKMYFIAFCPNNGLIVNIYRSWSLTYNSN